MGEALKKLKDIKGHPTMVQDMVEKYCCNSSKDECIQRTCEVCQFDNVYSQFNDEGNSSQKNSATSTNKEMKKVMLAKLF